jgi:hypothetical protein
MIGLEISINGKVVCRAAVPENNQLQSLVVLGGNFKQPEVTVKGYIEKENHVSEHLDFGAQYLNVEDEVKIRLIEIEKADEPIEAHTIDSSKAMKKMNENIEKEIARLKLQMEEHGREAVFPPPPKDVCAFCGKSKDEVNKFIAGMGDINICNECVSVCSDILSGKRKDPKNGIWPNKDA